MQSTLKRGLHAPETTVLQALGSFNCAGLAFLRIRLNLALTVNATKAHLNNASEMVLRTLRLRNWKCKISKSCRRLLLLRSWRQVWLRMRWSLWFLLCKVRSTQCTGNKRFQVTRLETRTKESTHICKCVSAKVMCIVKVKVIIFVVTTDFDLRREVWVWAYLLGPERWWTISEEGEARGNPGGGS